MLFYPILIFLLLVNVVFLKFMAKKLGLHNNTYINAITISILQFLSYGVMYFVTLFSFVIVYGVAGTPADRGPAGPVSKILFLAGFIFVPWLFFHKISQNAYGSKLKENTLMYAVLFFITFASFLLATTIFGNKNFEM